MTTLVARSKEHTPKKSGTAASEEQSSGVSQINVAVNQLSQTTQQNASSSEELAATAEEMSGQAEQLQQTMAFFKIAETPVRRGNAPARVPAAAAALRKAPAPAPLRKGKTVRASAIHLAAENDVDETSFARF